MFKSLLSLRKQHSPIIFILFGVVGVHIGVIWVFSGISLPAPIQLQSTTISAVIVDKAETQKLPVENPIDQKIEKPKPKPKPIEKEVLKTVSQADEDVVVEKTPIKDELEQQQPEEIVERLGSVAEQTTLESNNKEESEFDQVEDTPNLPDTSNLIVEPSSSASHLKNKPIAYPRKSLRRQEQGTVLLEVFVRADGSVGDVKLKESSGFIRLDQAAMEGVKDWHYTPAEQGGKVIDYWYVQPVNFALR